MTLRKLLTLLLILSFWAAPIEAHQFNRRHGHSSAPSAPVVVNALNSMTVANKSGAGQTSYPLRFGRPFIQGEISHFPQVVWNNVPIQTQANVKQRYPDGSVKYAIISVVLPTVPVSGDQRLTFQDQTTASDTPLTQAQMLNAAYDFDAKITLNFTPIIIARSAAKLVDFQAITNGSLAIVIDGVQQQVTGMDFSLACSTSAQNTSTSCSNIQNTVNYIIANAAATQGVTFVPSLIGTYSTGLIGSVTGPVSGAGHTIALGTPSVGTDLAPLLFQTVMNVHQGSTQTVSARTMLQNGNYSVWAGGQVAQTIELGDDSTARAYDLGPTGYTYRPFRPRFYATFWPGLNKVEVRYVGESGLVTEFDDLYYELSLSLGSASPQNVYSLDLTKRSAPFYHLFGSNWTKTFWIGGEPEPRINVDNNLPYLASTRFIANYDPTIVVEESTLAAAYADWSTSGHEPYQAKNLGDGLWSPGMGDTGGRPDIGPMPTWTGLWLYTGDWRLRLETFNLADQASMWGMNMRESAPGKRFSRSDPVGSSTGLGHPVSSAGRPSFLSLSGTGSGADNSLWVGPIRETQGKGLTHTWTPSHEPAPFYVPYLLTGDKYWLQMLYNWAGTNAVYHTYGAATACGRGPNGTRGGLGILGATLRVVAWQLRSRAETAFIAPDGDPEQAYFRYLMNDALGCFYGAFGITGTAYDGNSQYTHGQTYGLRDFINVGPNAGKPPLLHNWENTGGLTVRDSTVAAEEGVGTFQAGTVGSWTTVWMQHYANYGLGRTWELGFQAKPLLIYTAEWLRGLMMDTGYPQLSGAVHLPVEKRGGGFFTWNEVVTQGYTNSYLTTVLPPYFTANLASYADRENMAAGYVAMMVDAGAPGIQDAYVWLRDNVYLPMKALPATDPKSMRASPRWSIVPRTDNNVLPTISAAVPP